jgi:hypothetical protein
LTASTQQVGAAQGKEAPEVCVANGDIEPCTAAEVDLRPAVVTDKPLDKCNIQEMNNFPVKDASELLAGEINRNPYNTSYNTSPSAGGVDMKDEGSRHGAIQGGDAMGQVTKATTTPVIAKPGATSKPGVTLELGRGTIARGPAVSKSVWRPPEVAVKFGAV